MPLAIDVIVRPLALALVGVMAAAPVAAQCVSEWDTSLGNPGVEGRFPFVRPVLAWDDGSGERIYVGGRFDSIGGVPATYAAAWDPAMGEWSALGEGIEPALSSDDAVWELLPFDPGDGERLVVGGEFLGAGDVEGTASLAMWDGARWESMGAGWTREDHGVVQSMVEWKGRLYIGGAMVTPVDTIAGQRWAGIASWDGDEWQSHADFLVGTDVRVVAMAVFDDGSGEALYIGGNFLAVDGVPATGYIARFDGEEWSSVGGGVRGSEYFGIESMMVHDDGSGPALYVAGNMFTPAGERTTNVARWDGEKWTPIGPLLFGNRLTSMAMFDDGSGPALHIAGSPTPGGRFPAKLSEGAWETVGGGVDNIVHGLAVIGGDLYVSGLFETAGGHLARGLAIRTGCPCFADCDESGELDFFDFLCFQKQFAAQDPAADCDESGELDFFDFLCFQNAFAAGCP